MNNKEYTEQVKFVEYLKILEKQKKIISFFAIINETSVKNIRYGAKLKNQGKRAGVSDICVILQDKVLFVEMKRKREMLKSGKKSMENLASKEQLEFLSKINKTNICEGIVAYGFSEAKEFMEKMLILNPP